MLQGAAGSFGQGTSLCSVRLGALRPQEDRSRALLWSECVKTQDLHSLAAVDPGWLKAVDMMLFTWIDLMAVDKLMLSLKDYGLLYCVGICTSTSQMTVLGLLWPELLFFQRA